MPMLSGSGRPRIAMIGIDGFAPEWIERFLAEGAMPNLDRIRRTGGVVPLVSSLPATTPVAWATIASGCHPSSHGIDGFLLHVPGQSFDSRVSGTYATRCRREPLWETAALWGKRAYVVKFPLSYPSDVATLRIDGAAGWGGIICLHQACASGVADTARCDPGATSCFTDLARDQDGKIWRAQLEIATLWGGAPLRLACTLHPDTHLIEIALPGVPDPVRLNPGEWSEPVELLAYARIGEQRCAVRFKLIECTPGPDAPRVRLFHSPVHEMEGHSHPEALAQHHLSRAGPIEEETEPDLLLEGVIDFDTYLERCELNTKWLERICVSILDDDAWDLLMVHVHIVDWGHHVLHGAVDPRHPLHVPEERDAAIARLRAHYRLADDLVGAVTDRLEPTDDVVVLGDHGQDLHHTTIRLNELFAEHGWLAWSNDADTVIDWDRTRVHAAGNYLYLNVVGRDPAGILPPEACDAFSKDVCQVLRDLRDPRTGAAPTLVVGPRHDFASLGVGGDTSGDIIFCLASGYQARNDRGALFQLTVPGREFTSGHDHFHPRDPRIETRMYAAGPHFARGALGDRHSIIDVNPTLCTVLGIEPAFECEGKPIEAILAASHPADDRTSHPEEVACL